MNEGRMWPSWGESTNFM
jgi:hypothetical protein